MKSLIINGLFALIACGGTGCAHHVSITSDPIGADLILDGVKVGKTPYALAETSNASGAPQSIVLRKEGFEDFSGHLVRSYDWLQGGAFLASGAIACGTINVLTLSPLGWLVFLPAAGASIFSFKAPDKFHAVLEPQRQGATRLVPEVSPQTKSAATTGPVVVDPIDHTASPPCSKSADCRGGEICHSGQCRQICAGGSDCPDARICRSIPGQNLSACLPEQTEVPPPSL